MRHVRRVQRYFLSLLCRFFFHVFLGQLTVLVESTGWMEIPGGDVRLELVAVFDV